MAHKRRTNAGTRAAARERLLAVARAVAVPEHCDVCVLGGGAAGLVAAITAAEAGARTVVLERETTPGQTILATGNGRCNFANTRLDPSLYNDPTFVSAVTGTQWLADVLDFFDACGMAWAEETEGRLYPLSRQAASVRSVLLARAERAGVVLAPAREVAEVKPDKGGFGIHYREDAGAGDGRTLVARRLVWAVGGHSEATVSLDLACAPPQPVLCPLACTGPGLKRLDGRRVRCELALLRAGEPVAQETGEVLFRPWGLSGIAVFNLSRHAVAGDKLVLDLLPSLGHADLARLGAHTLDGMLDPVVAEALTDEAGSRAQASELAKRLIYTVAGPAESGHAQVMRGGLLTNQFDPATLEARGLPGFFACGEALNVDGPCGGYNLAWAWKSGMVAGHAAVSAIRHRR